MYGHRLCSFTLGFVQGLATEERRSRLRQSVPPRANDPHLAQTGPRPAREDPRTLTKARPEPADIPSLGLGGAARGDPSYGAGSGVDVNEVAWVDTGLPRQARTMVAPRHLPVAIGPKAGDPQARPGRG